MGRSQASHIFNHTDLPDPSYRYVSWVDLMGTVNIMTKSIPIASVNICKLYLYVTDAPNYEDVELYPMGDGMFIVADRLDKVQTILKDIFSSLAGEQIRDHNKNNLELKRLAIIKGTITSGTVREGKNMAQTQLSNHDFKNQLLFGQPVAKAHALEGEAPPFGIYRDESATRKPSDVWKWWDRSEMSTLLWDLLYEYYEFHQQHPEYNYPRAAIKAHRAEVFDYLRKPTKP